VASEGRSEFRFERLPGIGMPQSISLETVRFFMRFARGVMQCRRLFSDFKPAAILGMGGFTSTAPILAGRTSGVPVFVHESNAIPGRANRLNAKLCGGLLVGFDGFETKRVSVPVTVTGTPLRRDLLQCPSREDALRSFGLENDRPTVLIMGGSQGASGINRVMRDTAKILAAKDRGSLQFIHITGAADESIVRSAYQAVGIRAWVGAFHHAMQNAYTAADLAIARSGAASLTELAHFGVPSVLIPYPHAAEDHQTWNALIFKNAGAAALLQEAAASPETLARTMESILEPSRHAAFATAARSLSTDKAAEKVADNLIQAAGKGVGYGS
jgi:UDP-N-acetylglucosamine--N-acetylmuramyl-(pentapeptide) pyrophosphoryl-undecaprenol N-acetylglucosamine transferase